MHAAILNAEVGSDVRITDALTRVMEQSRARSAAILLVKEGTAAPAVRVLGTFGIVPDALSEYVAEIYKDDPFHSAAALSWFGQFNHQSYSVSGQVRQQSVSACADYWKFLHGVGSPSVGAAVTSIAEGHWISVGLHGPESWNPDISCEAREAVDHLTDAVMARMMRMVLAEPAALHRFSELIGFDHDTDAIAGVRSVDRPVIDLLARGSSNKHIASTLGMSETAVENRLRRLFRILGVRNRTQLVSKLTGGNFG